jgi:hypothetical protein
MSKSIFIDKNKTPNNDDLKIAFGNTFQFWNLLKDFVYSKYPTAIEEWNYSSEKYGWSFRIKDKKRAIIYFLPRDKFFKVAFVFGQKAFDVIMKSEISEEIKNELEAARVYAEGRGIRIEIKEETLICDVKKLIEIKINI